MMVKKTNMSFRMLFQNIQKFGKLEKTCHIETEFVIFSELLNRFWKYWLLFIFLIVIIRRLDHLLEASSVSGSLYRLLPFESCFNLLLYCFGQAWKKLQKDESTTIVKFFHWRLMEKRFHKNGNLRLILNKWPQRSLHNGYGIKFITIDLGFI